MTHRPCRTVLCVFLCFCGLSWYMLILLRDSIGYLNVVVLLVFVSLFRGDLRSGRLHSQSHLRPLSHLKSVLEKRNQYKEEIGRAMAISGRSTPKDSFVNDGEGKKSMMCSSAPLLFFFFAVGLIALSSWSGLEDANPRAQRCCRRSGAFQTSFSEKHELAILCLYTNILYCIVCALHREVQGRRFFGWVLVSRPFADYSLSMKLPPTLQRV